MVGRNLPYELNGAMRSGLVGALAEEKQALAGLGSPGSNMVGNISNLIMLESAHGLGVNGLRAEPEELFGVEEVPFAMLGSACSLEHCVGLEVVLTWGSWIPCAQDGPPQRV